jgi:hypothetical protein
MQFTAFDVVLGRSTILREPLPAIWKGRCKAMSPSRRAIRRTSLKPGDVLLVEGDSRISRAIKYLTQSTWSHAALYVGPITGVNTEGDEPHVLIEAEVGDGVVSAALSKYHHITPAFAGRSD